ncbi:hypothetical protein RvY_08332-2, partial [Ramazzottius varieornatus]
LGPLLFCVLIQKLTSPLNVWYLNDGTIGGKIETVLSDLQVVISEGWKLGLELNSAKCELFCFGGSALERQAAQGRAAVACPAIFFPSKSDLNLLGAPLMEESLEEAVRAKTKGPCIAPRDGRSGSVEPVGDYQHWDEFRSMAASDNACRFGWIRHPSYGRSRAPCLLGFASFCTTTGAEYPA